MTTSPILGLPELEQSQAIPEATVNEQMRGLEGFASLTVIEDRDLVTPPGSPVDGARYLVATGGTGAWSGHDGDVARYMSTAWEFHDVFEGLFAWVKNEDILIRRDGSAWAEYVPDTAPAGVQTESGTAYNLDAADAGKYLRFTGADPVVTVRDEADHALPANAEWHFRFAGSGTLVFLEDTSVTINPPVDGSLEVEPAGTVTLKRVAADTFDLFGVTAQPT